MQKLLLNFFKPEILRDELSILPFFHRLSFAVSCCERILPIYHAFCAMENWGDFSIPRKSIDIIWATLQGKEIDSKKVEKYREYCGHDNIFPDAYDFGDAYYCYEAQEVLMAVRATLAAYSKPKIGDIINVVRCTRNIIESSITTRDQFFHLSIQETDSEIFEQEFLKHSLAIREITKEEEDLKILRKEEILTPNSLLFLQGSSQQEGRELIALLNSWAET
ncbi:DUF416 family protein [Oscillatoriales cyanobacterium LEGE 11467]|uniref:DUF416 family protein n=1 Tax=Zarconia navalis LEGE 11467 TaxID=1828826 RepID=A0A928Z7C8_9CYAN|nr:YjaG family protein [Zarconia navalis]MBE9039249.1 DUF416 family protein [Zarconia navalis LEGE 11467]